MPETGFTVGQKTLTIQEAGNSVPYTGKLSDLAKHDVVSILDQKLKDDARKYFDIEAFLQFDACKLRASTTTSTMVGVGRSTRTTVARQLLLASARMSAGFFRAGASVSMVRVSTG